MKKTSKVIFAVLFLLTSSTAWAQSPRDQLSEMVGRLQKTENDNALRESIIKLATKIMPPPAIPEEARRAFVEGVTIVKSAKDSTSLRIAIEGFKGALKTAPWWSDAYYNLASTQELAGQFDEAEGSFKLFILASPDVNEAREALDRIYAIGAKRKIAVGETAAKKVKANLPVALVEKLQSEFGNRRFKSDELCWLTHGTDQRRCTESEAAEGRTWGFGLDGKPSREGTYTWMPMVDPTTNSIDLTKANISVSFRFVIGTTNRVILKFNSSNRDRFCGTFKGADGTDIEWYDCNTGSPIELRFGKTKYNEPMIEQISNCDASRLCARRRWVLEVWVME